MKVITFLSALIAVAFLAGCSTTSHRRDFSGIPATDFTLCVTCGEPSIRYTGTIVSDGHSELVSGKGNGTYYISAHKIACSFKKTDADGRISLAVSEAGKTQGSSSTISRFGGVRAEVLRTPSEQHDVFTTF